MFTFLFIGLPLTLASPVPTETDVSKREDAAWGWPAEDQYDEWSDNRVHFNQPIEPAPTTTLLASDWHTNFQDWPGYWMRPDMEDSRPFQKPSFEDKFEGWSGNRFYFTQAAEAPEATTTSLADDWYTRFQDWPDYGVRLEMEAPKPTQQPQNNGWAWPEN